MAWLWRRAGFVAFCLGVLFASRALAAPAENSESAQAKALYEKGMAHFHLEEYDQAIEQWEAGYRIRPVPEFLYNIAQAHRLAKRPEKAIKFYNKFLYVSPNAPNRAEVERHIAALEKAVHENESAATSPPATTREPSTTPSTTTTPPPSTSTTTPPAATPEPTPQIVAAPPPKKKPVYKKAWFWGVIGGTVAAAVIVGVTVGVVVGRRDQAEVLSPVRF